MSSLVIGSREGHFNGSRLPRVAAQSNITQRWGGMLAKAEASDVEVQSELRTHSPVARVERSVRHRPLLLGVQ